jgi:hypothetical protein
MTIQQFSNSAVQQFSSSAVQQFSSSAVQQFSSSAVQQLSNHYSAIQQSNNREFRVKGNALSNFPYLLFFNGNLIKDIFKILVQVGSISIFRISFLLKLQSRRHDTVPQHYWWYF